MGLKEAKAGLKSRDYRPFSAKIFVLLCNIDLFGLGSLSVVVPCIVTAVL